MNEDKKRALLAVLMDHKIGQISSDQALKEINQIYEHHSTEKTNQESNK